MARYFLLLPCALLLAAGPARGDTPPAKAAEKTEAKKAEAKPAEEPDPNAEYQKQLEAEKKKLIELAKTATHAPAGEIKVKGKRAGNALQTLCLDNAGNLLALVAPPRHFNAPAAGVTSEVHQYDGAGKLTAEWTVPFHAHAINAGPDGTVYVAGDGKVARFKGGKPAGEVVELPFVAELLKDQAGLKKKAEKTIKEQAEQIGKSLEQAKKQVEEQVKKIEAKPEAERTKSEKRTLQQAPMILESYKSSLDYYTKRTPEDVVKELTSRLRIVNGVAASETDVFVACGETEGYGYAIWRMAPDLTAPKQVLTGIGGCCGQMDVQVQGKDLLVAENTRHQFARYDRDGKKVGSYGKRGQDTDPSCFGGCCNPMNVRACGATGDVFAAESEGIVKRFGPDGKYMGTAVAVPLSGGCKNVAVAVTSDAGKVYFCDQPGGKVLIFAAKEAGGLK